jgi:hypothetical protein
VQNIGVNPPKPYFALTVGITGHRPNKLRDYADSDLQKAIEEVLAAIRNQAVRTQASYADCFAERELQMILTTALAEGSDSIAAAAANAQDYKVDVVLPFLATDYQSDFSLPGVMNFVQLCEKARAILEIDGDRADEARAYEAASLVVLDMSDILIAVWDGKPAAGRGGTAELVAEASRRGMPIIRIDSEGVAPVRIYWRGLSERHTAPVHIDGHPSADLQEKLPEILDALIRPPRSQGEQELLRRYLGESAKKFTWRVEFPLLMALLGVRAFRWRDFWLAQPETLAQQLLDKGAPPPMVRSYGWADAIAVRYGQIFRGAFVANFAVSALAVILAVMPLPVLWDLLEIALVLFLVVNTVAGQKAQWHRRWIEAREVAERLRIAIPMRAIGTRAFGPFGDAPTWTTWYVRAKLRESGLQTNTLNAAGLARARTTLVELLTGQRNYHEATARRFQRVHDRLAAVGTYLFVAALIMTTCQFVVEYFHLYPISDTMHRWIVAASASLPTLASASFGMRVIGEFDSASRRSERMMHQLNSLLAIFERTPDNVDLLRDLAHHAADVISGDVASWRMVVESRELEMPS